MSEHAQEQGGNSESKKPRGKPFVKGDKRINAGGRPRGSISLRAAALRAMSAGMAEKVIQRLYKSAMAGSVHASKLLAELTGDLGAGSQIAIQNIVASQNPPAEIKFYLPINGRESVPASDPTVTVLPSRAAALPPVETLAASSSSSHAAVIEPQPPAAEAQQVINSMAVPTPKEEKAPKGSSSNPEPDVIQPAVKPETGTQVAAQPQSAAS